MKNRNPYSAMYRPDRSFMKQLKRVHSRLDCKYRIDLELFAITWEMPLGPDAELMLVRDDMGGFRHPDQRDIDMICEGDIHRTNIKERIQKTEKYMRDWREKEDAYRKDEIRNSTKDDKIQLINEYRRTFNIGSKTPEFRRIKPKVKGKTVDELQNCVAQ